MRIRTIVAALIALPIAVAAVANAHTIEADCGDMTFAGRNVTALGDGDTTIYIDDRDHFGTGFDEVDGPVEEATEPEDERGDSYAYSVWIYAESGNHPGLQTVKGTPGSVDSSGLEVCSTGKHGNNALNQSDLLIF